VNSTAMSYFPSFPSSFPSSSPLHHRGTHRPFERPKKGRIDIILWNWSSVTKSEVLILQKNRSLETDMNTFGSVSVSSDPRRRTDVFWDGIGSNRFQIDSKTAEIDRSNRFEIEAWCNLTAIFNAILTSYMCAISSQFFQFYQILILCWIIP